MAEWRGTVESVAVNREFWRGRRVFLTGHTGFKGGWLALWLEKLGAQVYGYSLEPPTSPNLYNEAGIAKRLAGSIHGDIRDYGTLHQAMQSAQPEVVFHLAAQPLVRDSYTNPLETYAVNVMGTANLLQAVRDTPGVKAVVNVTSDKCYENREWPWPYRENDPLGGHDPYSSSKACAEIVSAAYRRSFLAAASVQLASTRVGNVIGGGDWAKDRLLPDFLRALDAGQTLQIRSPNAIRPWQHVLEPLAGYLLLAERLSSGSEDYSQAWNFGPEEGGSRSVRWIVEQLCTQLPAAKWHTDDQSQPHEAHILRLDSAKARSRLGWRPRWRLETALEQTLAWHLAWCRGEAMDEFSLQQIAAYEATAQS